MAPGPSHELREKLADVLLALQMLGRASGMREHHRRIAEPGLLSAQKLARLLLLDRTDSPQTRRAPNLTRFSAMIASRS
jgi:hypothetical protein